MKIQICPCCEKEITFFVFMKSIFFSAFKKTPIAENYRGYDCPFCGRSIISASRFYRFIPMFFVPLFAFPFFFQLLNTWVGILVSILYIILIILVAFFSYLVIELICDDKHELDSDITGFG